jgi:hypothetical protein
LCNNAELPHLSTKGTKNMNMKRIVFIVFMLWAWGFTNFPVGFAQTDTVLDKSLEHALFLRGVELLIIPSKATDHFVLQFSLDLDSGNKFKVHLFRLIDGDEKKAEKLGSIPFNLSGQRVIDSSTDLFQTGAEGISDTEFDRGVISGPQTAMLRPYGEVDLIGAWRKSIDYRQTGWRLGMKFQGEGGVDTLTFFFTYGGLDMREMLQSRGEPQMSSNVSLYFSDALSGDTQADSGARFNMRYRGYWGDTGSLEPERASLLSAARHRAQNLNHVAVAAVSDMHERELEQLARAIAADIIDGAHRSSTNMIFWDGEERRMRAEKARNYLETVLGSEALDSTALVDASEILVERLSRIFARDEVNIVPHIRNALTAALKRQ